MSKCTEILWIVPSIFLLLRTPCCQGVNVTGIRLVDENGDPVPAGSGNGRIQIRRDGGTEWGEICDDNFRQNEVIVACRQLGFLTGMLAGENAFGTEGRFFMDDTDCTGGELTLTQCQASQVSDCAIGQDFAVSVQCTGSPGDRTVAPVTTTASSQIIDDNCQSNNPTVRLSGKAGVPGMGFVEVRNPVTRSWGFVCDDGWNQNAAKVVCAQLCFPTNYPAKPGIPAEHIVYPQNPTIILDQVSCTGTESRLEDCSHGAWGREDCMSGSGELAGVQCLAAEYKPPESPIPVLNCGGGKLEAIFSKVLDPNLEEKHLTIFDDPGCPDVTKSATSDTVTIVIPVDKCGTTIETNGTFAIYRNSVKYDYTTLDGFISRVNTYRVKLECALPLSASVTQRVDPMTEVVTQKSVGNFRLSMELYRNDSFNSPITTSPVQVPLGEFINIAVVLTNDDDRLKLVVTDCVATATGDVNGRTIKQLIQNKCPVEKTLSTYPLSDYKFGIRLQTFTFVGFPLLYLHCNTYICQRTTVSQQCDRTCDNEKPTAGRRRRSVEYTQSSVDSVAIIIYNPQVPGNGNNKDSSEGKDDLVILEQTSKPTQSIPASSTQQPPRDQEVTPPSTTFQGPVDQDEDREDDSDVDIEDENEDNDSLVRGSCDRLGVSLWSLVTWLLIAYFLQR